MWPDAKAMLQPFVTARLEALLTALTSTVADFSVCVDVVPTALVLVMETQLIVLPDTRDADGVLSVTSYLRTGVPGPAAVEPAAAVPTVGLSGLEFDVLLQAADSTTAQRTLRIEKVRVVKSCVIPVPP